MPQAVRAQASFPITVDPGAYPGDYFVSGTRYSGVSILSLAEGNHAIFVGNANSVGLTVDNAGNVTSLNTDAMTASGGTVTFSTVAITVDPAGFSGPGTVWHIPATHPKTSGTVGPVSVTLVPALSYRMLVGEVGFLDISLDAAGNVSTPNAAAASTSGSTITFNTTVISVDPAGLTSPFAVWLVWDAGPKTPTSDGITNVTLVPGLDYWIVLGVTQGFIPFSVDGAGQVVSGDPLAMTAQGTTLTFNTTTVFVDPGTFADVWEVFGVSAKTAGPAAVTLIPGNPAITYQFDAFIGATAESAFFSVTAPCSVSPGNLTLHGAQFSLSCAPPGQTEYYIDSVAGDDIGAGTEPDPWRTLSRLDGVVLFPGDQVFLKRGSVFRERLIIDEFSNGTAAQPIVIDAYGDAADPLPVISAGELIPLGDAGWTGPDVHGAYRRPLGDTSTYYTCCPAMVRGDPAGIDTYTLLARGVGPIDGGIDLATALAQLEPGSYMTNIEFPDGRVLYYKPPVGAVPQDFEFEFSKRNTAILVDGDHVELRNVEAILGNQGHPTLDPPVLGATVNAFGANFSIRDCTVAFGRAFGMMVFGPDSLVDGCTAEHNHSTGIVLQQTAATGSVIQNSIARFNGNLETIDEDRGGIGTQSSNTVIRNNVIHDNGNINDNTPPRIAGDAAIALFEAHDVLVEGNFIYNSARSAIQASRGPQSYRQRIIGNVIYNWNLVGPACDPDPVACPNGSAARSAIALFGFDDPNTAGLFDIQNNTIYSDQAGIWLYGIQLGLSFNTDLLRNSTVLNNIVHMPNNTDPRSVGLRATRSQNYDTDVEIDFNDIYLPLTPGPNNYETTTHGIGPDIALLGEPEYEVSSLHADPDLNLGLANPADPARYDLLPGSPVIDAGTDVERTGDFLGRPVPAGAAPDMGAFESPIFCIDDDFDGICDDLDLCPAGPLVVQGFLAPMGALSAEGEAPVAPDNAFKANRTLPLKLTLACGGLPVTDLNVPPPTISEIARDGEALDLPTIDLDSGGANDEGLAFRFDEDAWIYNLSTRGLEPGSYVISVTTPENSSYAAAFVLR